jgi:phosphoserine phosphatase
MVVGHEDMTNRLVAVDLDGTYVRGNTLHIYISEALRYNLRHLRIDRVAGMSALLALRKLGLISHTTMKFGCLRLSGRSEELLKQFVERVNSRINRDVAKLIDDYAARGAKILLASAAADFYVKALWHGDYVATQFDNNPKHIECRGAVKVDRVKRRAAELGATLYVVITDHPDDLPLLDANHDGVNYIVSRTSGEVSRFLGQF